ncbi:MAG: ABC transporter ATP-binding protein [Clostridia bacterium]|nr:ABC transporter ATP-binding protein [Clostridia bacterium]
MSKKKPEKVKISQAIRNTSFILKIAFKASPGLCIMRLLMGIITGLNHGVNIYFISEILNAVDLKLPVGQIFAIIGAMAAYNLAYILFYNWHWKIYNPRYKLDFIRRLHKRFFVKAWEIDLACYDTPEFYNDFIYSMQNSDKSITGTLDHISDLLRCFVASISVLAIMLDVNYIIALAIFGFAILNMVIGIIENGIYYKYDIMLNKIYRKEWYIDRFFSLSDYAKEIRITDISSNMMDEYHKNKDEERKYHVKRNIRITLINIVRTILQIAENVFIILFMAYHLMVTEDILIGGFAIALMSANKLRGMIWEIQYRITQMSKNSLYADKVRRFLETKSEMVSGDKILDTFESLEFRNVCFAYKDKNVLENVSFKINKGERVAFVGYNGAGKTTTTKLIMRLYDVTSGEILINGINIKEYDLESLRDKMGAVFQDYKVFAATVAENVLADKYTPDREQTVLNALRDSTFGEKLDTLEKGINTELTREFYDDGTELSGGESQKIAIARVFAHNNELIIMDEPSSALDPIAEYNLNVGIDKNARDKTVVFITHRLSTTRHVDRIYMFEYGRITEQGSHDHLIIQNGNYAKMFNLQADKYKVKG